MCILSCTGINAQMNFSWTRSIGGSGADDAQAIATGTNGNVYVAGAFSGTVDFDPSPATFTIASAGGTDGFVAVFDANGNFINAVSFTNNLECKVYSMATDNLGNIILTGGFTGSVDFEPGPGVTQLVAGGFYDIFLVKLTANLGFTWAQRFGYAGGDDHGFSVATDANNNVLVTGYFQGPNIDFDPGAPTFYISSQGLKDIFILKLDPSAGFLWAFGLGSSGSFQEIGQTIKTDASGNVIVGGYFSATVDFDAGTGTQTITTGGNYDAFVAKYSPNGAYIWADKFSGAGDEVCYALQPDGNGNIYCTGSFAGGTVCDFDPSASTYSLISIGANPDVFVTKLTSNGNFVWAKAFGGTGSDYGRAIALDANTVYSSGYFTGIVDFDPSASTNTILSNGGSDFFLSRLDLSGNYLSAYSYGALGNDFAFSMCSPTTGIIYTAGNFSNTVDFDASVGTSTLSSMGLSDAYFYKLQDITVGIKEINANDNIQIYPNPISSELNVVVNEMFNLDIYNVSGVLVYSQSNCVSNCNINLEDAANGIYFAKIKTNQGITVTKIIKQ